MIGFPEAPAGTIDDQFDVAPHSTDVVDRISRQVPKESSHHHQRPGRRMKIARAHLNSPRIAQGSIDFESPELFPCATVRAWNGNVQNA
jgi:hypothetical protein